MLQQVVGLSLRYRGVVLALAIVLFGWGIFEARHAKLDVLPDFANPQIVVQTESPGLTALQVELLVTNPVESAVAGIPGIDEVRSDSIQGLSIVTLILKEGADLMRTRNLVGESLAEAARRLPEIAKAPRMSPPVSATMDLLKIGLLSDTATPMELRTFADYVLKPRLRAVPGVAGVSVFGGEVQQLHVRTSPERLAASGVSWNDVLDAVRNATGVTGAGFVESGSQRLFIEAQGQALSPAAIASTIVRQNGLRRVTLADVATVEFGAEPKFGDTLIQGRPGVLITMMSQYGSNTMDATRAVESTLDELSATIERAGVKVHGRLHRPATFIENALENIRRSLWVGAALVAVILILFLNDVRAAVISLAAIPLSLLVAVLVMNACGATLNTMSLGGLAMALGEVVDDAIIDVENILRRLRQRMQSGSKSSIVRTVLDASLEVRGSVVYATIVVALVFLPVIFLSGLEGKLFAPLGIAYVLATGASLLVALTITPALSMLWLPRGTSERREPRLQRALRSIYQKALRAVFRARWFALAMVVVLLAVTGALVTRLGGEFLPPFREGHFVLHVSEAPGASLEEMSRIGRNISAALLEIAGVDTVVQQIGRAELGEDPFAPNRSEFHVELKRVSPSDEERIEGEIRRVLQAVPGIRFDIMTFLGDRISETITGETAPVVIRLFGDDLDELDRTASRIADVATGVAGAVDIQPSAFQGWPQTTIRLKRDRIQQLGFRPGDVLRGVQAALQGVVAAQVQDAARTLDVVVFSGRGSREGPESIGGLMLQNEAGLQAPLAELAEVKFEEGRARVRHWGGRRWQSITCNVEGRDTDSVVADLRARIGREVRFPSNSFFDIAGTSEARARGEYQLLRNGAAAGAGILLILALAFGSARNLALVLLNLPFALVGGVFALAWTNHSLSMGSLVGFVTLFGISTRNSIMLVSHFQHLVGVEGAAWNVDTAIRGASERVIPILMTALVTGIGLLPIAAGSGDAGREVEGPMAIVIVGGLVTSTLLNLFVLPVLCERFGRFPVMNPAGALAP